MKGKQKEVKARYGWEINPRTRVVPSGKTFSRSKEKRALDHLLKTIRESE